MNFNIKNRNPYKMNVNNRQVKKRNNKTLKSDTFKLNIYYKISDYAGTNGGSNNDGYYLYTEKKDISEFQFIDVGDKVQYNNPTHPNHLKRAIVRKYNRNAEFEIIFNDPPFLYEIDKKTNNKYKTNKKIKIINNVKFRNLKKLTSTKSSLTIKQAVIHGGIKKKYNLRDFFETPIKDPSEEYSNETLLLYRTLLFLFTINITDENDNSSIKEIKEIIANMNIVKNEDSQIYNQISNKLNELIKLKYKSNKNFFYLDIRDFLITFNSLSNEEFVKKLEAEESFNEKGVERKKNASLANAYSFFEKLLGVFKKKKGTDNLRYNVIDLGITNKKQYYTFLQNLKKKKSEIMDKKFLTYQDVLEKKINEKIRRNFLKGDRFYPEEVKFKYSGISENENNKDINRLIKPSENMKFTIVSEPEIKNDLIQDNDFVEKDGETEKIKKMFIIKKIPDNQNPGEIDIYIKLDLDSEKIIDDEDDIEDSIKNPSGVSLFKIASNMVKNIQKNLDCENVKKNIKQDADDIYDLLKNKLGSQEFKEPYVAKTSLEEKNENATKTVATVIPFNNRVSFIKRQVKKGGRKNRTLKKR
tara:strand:+ start:15765 stop:17516 length:1752 start_codon:yes stop_codon:yes gene_type:complete